MKRIPMTPRGYEALRKELRECKAERPRLADVIEAARELGDLKENAEYHAAKEKQGFLEGRIQELESKIGLAEVIDPNKLKGEKVVFGATVHLESESGEAAVYTIVGDDEADVKQGMISINSPIARALIGHTIGDEVAVAAPAGRRSYEISDVTFGDRD
ncbi:MAG: transcription elongation factor GreA [Myxococcales bacterium]|nr:transcription elongation factor GreA [Myxococcales bacterium]